MKNQNYRIDPKSPIGLYLAEMDRRQRNSRIIAVMALTVVFVVAGVILAN